MALLKILLRLKSACYISFGTTCLSLNSILRLIMRILSETLITWCTYLLNVNMFYWYLSSIIYFIIKLNQYFQLNIDIY